MVNVLVDLPSKIHSRIKMLAAMKKTTMKDMTIELLGDSVWAHDDESWGLYVKDLLADQ